MLLIEINNMSNDHRANTTNTPSIKIEARPDRAVPDKNDKLMQAEQNKLQSKYMAILNLQMLSFYQGGTLK